MARPFKPASERVNAAVACVNVILTSAHGPVYEREMLLEACRQFEGLIVYWESRIEAMDRPVCSDEVVS